MERSTRLFAAVFHAHWVRQFAFLGFIASCAFATGCAEHRRACMPKGLLAPETTIDLDSAGENDHTRDRELLSASLARLKVAPEEADAQRKKYNVLALSGGGSYGAFTAG